MPRILWVRISDYVERWYAADFGDDKSNSPAVWHAFKFESV
jgi:hypothetical protein